MKTTKNALQQPASDQLNAALGAERMMLGSFKLIVFSTVFFAAIGALVGWLLALLTPGYYRAAYDADNSEIWQIGVGLGVTQGLMAGVIVGCVVVFSSALYRSRIRHGILREIQDLDTAP